MEESKFKARQRQAVLYGTVITAFGRLKQEDEGRLRVKAWVPAVPTKEAQSPTPACHGEGWVWPQWEEEWQRVSDPQLHPCDADVSLRFK